MTRRLIVGGALAGVTLSTVFAIVGIDWWALPALAVGVTLVVRVLIVAERSGANVATMKRNAERVRVLEKERHGELLSTITSRAGTALPTPASAVEQTLPARVVTSRPQERLDGADAVRFDVRLPEATSSVSLWLEAGGFDVLPAEYIVTIEGDEQLLWRGEVGDCEAGAMVSLGRFDLRSVGGIRVRAEWPPGLRTGLPPALAFVALAAVMVDHPVLPGASMRVTGIGGGTDA